MNYGESIYQASYQQGGFMKKVVQVLSFATLATLLGGCASYNQKNQYTATQMKSDQVISADITQAFAQDKRLRHYNISVNTTQGVVTLAGHVSSKHLRKHAIYLARTTVGVVGVDASMFSVGRVHHNGVMSNAAGKNIQYAAKDQYYPALAANSGGASGGVTGSNSGSGSSMGTPGNPSNSPYPNGNPNNSNSIPNPYNPTKDQNNKNLNGNTNNQNNTSSTGTTTNPNQPSSIPGTSKSPNSTGLPTH